MTRPLPQTGNAFLKDLSSVVVAGLGRSGRGAADLLAAHGVPFQVVDARAASLGAEVTDTLPPGTPVHGEADAAAVLAAADLVVVSPGIDLRREPWAAARAAGVPFMGELELAWRFVQSPVVAITGSNGKSTVTSLIGRLLAATGRDARVCGNIGSPLSAAVARQQPDTVFVVEVSSFQLETVSGFHPQVAVLLNVTADHQDRYDHADDYLAAKERIFARQGSDDAAILDMDDPAAAAVAARLACRSDGPAPLPVSLRAEPEGDGAWLRGDTLMVRVAGRELTLGAKQSLSLVGPHNITNALAAGLAVARLGETVDREALAAFPPLPHRLETVAERRGIRFVNDSKATNVESARVALRAFPPASVHLILGGRDKGGAFADLAAEAARHACAVYAMGEAGPAVAAALGPVLPLSLPLTVHAGMQEAVAAATAAARPGQVVLLAPACASFDAYPNFMARGDHFRRLVGGSEAGGHHGA